MIVLNILYIIAGIAIVLVGADKLTEGAAAVATKFKVPQIVIGLTIVAIGTSMPELCVSLVSALKGTPDLAVGNVVGSNVFNSFLIVGITALVAPMTILHSTVRNDIPFALVASVLLLLLCLDGSLSRIDSIILLLLFAVFMRITLAGAKAKKENENEGAARGEQSLLEPSRVASEEGNMPNEAGREMAMWKAALFIVAGLVMLIFGSNLFVDNATEVARIIGVSEAVTGLTIVAMGTSMPELATSVVAAKKGNSGIAIGNVLGSNVFNILLILGTTGVICPMQLNGITNVDFSAMVISMFMLWLFSFTKYKIERWEGAVLTLAFIGYVSWLIYNV